MLPLTQILIHSSFISFYLFFYHYYYFFPSSIFSVNEIIIIIKIGQKLGYDKWHIYISILSFKIDINLLEVTSNMCRNVKNTIFHIECI
jgi:hypothetical protein